jgi:hypothetical protein
MPRLDEFLVQPEDEQGVKAVYNGEAQVEPVQRGTGRRINLIGAPGVLPSRGGRRASTLGHTRAAAAAAGASVTRGLQGSNANPMFFPHL